MTYLVLFSIVVNLAGNKISRKKVKLKLGYLRQKKAYAQILNQNNIDLLYFFMI